MKNGKEWAKEKYGDNVEFATDFDYDDICSAFNAGQKAMKDEIKDRLKKYKKGKNA